jgi:hypothetical protein
MLVVLIFQTGDKAKAPNFQIYIGKRAKEAAKYPLWKPYWEKADDVWRSGPRAAKLFQRVGRSQAN